VTGTDSHGTPTTYENFPSPSYYTTSNGGKYTTSTIQTPTGGYETITYNTVPTKSGYETFQDTTTSRGATYQTTGTDEVTYSQNGGSVSHIEEITSTGGHETITESTAVTGHGGIVTYYTVETPSHGTSQLTEFTNTVNGETLTYVTGTNSQGEFTQYTEVDGYTPLPLTVAAPTESVRTECFLVDSTGAEEPNNA